MKIEGGPPQDKEAISYGAERFFSKYAARAKAAQAWLSKLGTQLLFTSLAFWKQSDQGYQDLFLSIFAGYAIYLARNTQAGFSGSKGLVLAWISISVGSYGAALVGCLLDTVCRKEYLAQTFKFYRLITQGVLVATGFICIDYIWDWTDSEILSALGVLPDLWAIAIPSAILAFCILVGLSFYDTNFYQAFKTERARLLIWSAYLFGVLIAMCGIIFAF